MMYNVPATFGTELQIAVKYVKRAGMKSYGIQMARVAQNHAAAELILAGRIITVRVHGMIQIAIL